MKYCIGCRHLHFTSSDPGWSTDVTAGIDAHEASMACRKGHWHEDLDDDEDLFYLEKAMQRAETCSDFQERPTQT